MPQFATALCTVFFVYGVQVSALGEVDLLKSQFASTLTSVGEQYSILNSTYYELSYEFRESVENISAIANGVLLSYEDELLAALATAPPGVDTTPCIPSNSTLIAALQKFQTKSITCIGNLSNVAYYQVYDTILNDNLRYQSTLDQLVADVVACGSLVLDPCVSAVKTKFTALTSDPGFIAALAPNLASDILTGFQADISNCLDTPSLSEAIRLSDENIAFAVKCVADLQSVTP